jgi:hypothetical protein
MKQVHFSTIVSPRIFTNDLPSWTSSSTVHLVRRLRWNRSVFVVGALAFHVARSGDHSISAFESLKLCRANSFRTITPSVILRSPTRQFAAGRFDSPGRHARSGPVQP